MHCKLRATLMVLLKHHVNVDNPNDLPHLRLGVYNRPAGFPAGSARHGQGRPALTVDLFRLVEDGIYNDPSTPIKSDTTRVASPLSETRGVREVSAAGDSDGIGEADGSLMLPGVFTYCFLGKYLHANKRVLPWDFYIYYALAGPSNYGLHCTGACVPPVLRELLVVDILVIGRVWA